MNRRQMLLSGAAVALAPRLTLAQTAKPLKIGVMNDMSSVYSDYQGIGSVVAARLAVDDYFALGYVPDPGTIYQGIRKLPAAHGALGGSATAPPSPSLCQSFTSAHSAYLPSRVGRSHNRRIAGYGPVCPVVWEGRSRETPPYPDWPQFSYFPHTRDMTSDDRR